MNDLIIIKILRDSLITILIVVAPVLGVGVVVSFVISIFQAATSIQDQTLSFVPKIVVMFLTIIILAVWISKILTSYTLNIFSFINGGG